MKPATTLSRLAWFVAIWVAGVGCLAAVAFIIRLMIY